MTGDTEREILLGMAKVKVTVWGWRCERCGHDWLPREQNKPEPKVCPSCKSPYWNTPRRARMTPEKSATE